MAVITLALSKGRIFDETLPLLAKAGVRALDDPEGSRKLVLRTSRRDLRLLIVRASDVPTYVQYGAAELGVAGKDVLLEHGGDGLYQPLDLGIAACRMVVAVPEGFDYAGAVRRGARLRVATKYMQTAREHFAAKGVHVDHQALRLDGARSAPGPRRRDRRSGRDRQHAARQQAARGGGDSPHQRPPDREPGGAQAQARRGSAAPRHAGGGGAQAWLISNVYRPP